jgi:DNA-binding beta-propeller fold protein YncE
LDAEVVSPPGRAYQPVGFGEGSLWALELDLSATCDDTVVVGSAASSGGASASASSGVTVVTEELCVAPAPPDKTLLKRLDPRTGEEVAAVPLEGFIGTPEVAVGAGSVWVSSDDISSGPAPKRGPGDVVLRVDPETNRVVDRIPVDSPSGLAFGHGSVWATSAGHGTVSRIDPQTGRVVAEIKVGRGAVDIATDERSGAVWVAGLHLQTYGADFHPEDSKDNKLSRVDPATNRVVAEIPIVADSPVGGASSVAVGEGAVWAQSADGKLFKVDPATNKVAAMVSVGEWSYPPTPHLAVYGGAVWAMVQTEEFRLVRVDPRTAHVVAYKDLRPFDIVVAAPGLAAGRGYVWFSSGHGLARVAP